MFLTFLCKPGRRLTFFLAAFFLLMAGCDSDPFFVPVLSVYNIPETVELEGQTPNAPIYPARVILDGKVSPNFATNRDIVWSIVSYKMDGVDMPPLGKASISGNTLIINESCTVVINAKIVNGKAEGQDYSQNFTIDIWGYW